MKMRHLRFRRRARLDLWTLIKIALLGLIIVLILKALHVI
jgi:hypothetical protein